MELEKLLLPILYCPKSLIAGSSSMLMRLLAVFLPSIQRAWP